MLGRNACVLYKEDNLRKCDDPNPTNREMCLKLRTLVSSVCCVKAHGLTVNQTMQLSVFNTELQGTQFPAVQTSGTSSDQYQTSSDQRDPGNTVPWVPLVEALSCSAVFPAGDRITYHCLACL